MNVKNSENISIRGYMYQDASGEMVHDLTILFFDKMGESWDDIESVDIEMLKCPEKLVKEVLATVVQSPSTKQLDLHSLELTESLMTELGRYVGRSQTLEVLDLSDHDESLEFFLRRARSNLSVKNLNLTNCPLEQELLGMVVEWCRKGSIHTLTMDLCELGSEHLELLEALLRVPSLRNLTMPSNESLGTEGLSRLDYNTRNVEPHLDFLDVSFCGQNEDNETSYFQHLLL